MTAIPSAAAFHRHLDTCAQCRGNPFLMCNAGHALLISAANQPEEIPASVVPHYAVVPPVCIDGEDDELPF